jgi:hypothetical protein
MGRKIDIPTPTFLNKDDSKMRSSFTMEFVLPNREEAYSTVQYCERLG